ncbi:hypothetical protein FACS189421_13560 [Bacteroidia bacterium]|nr:hypothetical protein FACS189421_13560 [Bacteroidia bacterium]GHT04253.1 hypothetical protein FACS189423_06670 [Bacteroidia bacterium]GHT51843.1 hypothetical protein FACS189440_21320 [Bacteroidia bacterium]
MSLEKILFRKEWIYILAGFSWLFIFFNLPVGFKSYVDEAFFVLGLNPEQNLGIQHSQFFQIARFIFGIFHLSPTILTSRIVAYICISFTLLFFSGVSYYWLHKKEKISGSFGLYVSLVFLCGIFMYFSGYEMSFSFNHLLVFFATSLLSFYLLWDVSDKPRIKCLFIFLIGCFSFLSIVNYFPSGILVSLVLLVLLVLKTTGHWSHKFLSFVIYTIGFAACAFAYNAVVFPVEQALNEIVISIQNPAFGTGGYDLFSYLKIAGNYTGNFLVLFLCSAGICFLYFINQKQNYWDKQLIAVYIFVALLILIALNTKFFRYHILLMPILIAVLFYYLSLFFSKNEQLTKKQSVLIIQGLVIFFFPAIALLGTNVSIEYKLAYTSFIWVFLLSNYLFRIKNKIVYKSVLYLTVCIASGMGYGGYLQHYRDIKGNLFDSTCRVENNKEFNHIKLKQKQMNYFQRVDSLLKANHFNPEKDRILAFDTDYAVLLYVNATNYGGLMHHIENIFAYKDIFFSHANAPDFIIVPQRDAKEFKKMAKTFQWNFPEECTEYSLGNPEKGRTGPRSLLVKKKKNIE